MAMAYYPGNYHRSGFQHIGDYYSQGLFGATSQRPHEFDPYSDSNLDEYEYESSRPSRRRSRTTYNTSHTPPSSSPPRPSQRRSASPPSRPTHPPDYAPPLPSRTRSKTPPQFRLTPPPPAAPSSSYLDFASEPSQTLSEPTRKLLILDLNGSLLLRSARIPKSYRGQHQHNKYPAPRRVMPRPYLTAFRAYLFAPQTRAWLDVMVWSSAQPHSVEDMVLHAFGSDRDKLFAIWARDTLGLAEDHYHRKVQTIKDLERPWAALTPQDPASSPPPQTQTQTGHSAATTILLDDSHAKAARQPHNHLCVPEYTRARRNVDLVALQHKQEQDAHAAAAAATAAHEAEAEEPTALDASSPSAQAQDGDDEAKRPKRKRKKEKKQQQQQSASSPATAAQVGTDAAASSFDETLLAVVGILHAARLQSSIAGWMRAGALLSERGEVWCDDPALVHEWALRGREAMHELQLDVEHGITPDP